MITFNHLPSECNPSDLLSKHWGHAQVWQLLQPILFWKGDTADLCHRSTTPTGKKGSNKCSVQTGPTLGSETVTDTDGKSGNDLATRGSSGDGH